MYDENICCDCEDSGRYTKSTQFTVAVLRTGWKVTERQRLILIAHANNY
jgi:hypothetical protein